jgi:hypothetical protein
VKAPGRVNDFLPVGPGERNSSSLEIACESDYHDVAMVYIDRTDAPG